MDSLIKQKKDRLVVGDEFIHYYRVRIPNHPNGVKQMCIGLWRDVETVLERYPDANVTKVFPPDSPRTVDVPYVTIKDQQLPMQQILPESNLEEINLK